jgi:uncharacterized membrane protein
MKKDFKIIQIRFNVNSTDETNRWRLIIDGEETLVAHIIVDGHTYTTMDWIPEIKEHKWHISCKGYLEIVYDTAYVKTVTEESVFARHILKTISYRILGTATTFITAYCLGASIELASFIGIGEVAYKPVIYFLHERIWYKYLRIKRK